MSKFYYKDGSILDYWNENKVLHRVDGPAVEWSSGNKYWFINGELHRIDGPAVEWNNGYKEWWVYGKRHRLDGPAIEWNNGYKEWWIDGEKLFEEEFNNHPKILKYKYEQQFYQELMDQLLNGIMDIKNGGLMEKDIRMVD